ncbi:MAG: regulatory protein RecX [Candidatus Omnitrophota bacterium]|nr:regulatory protein RecX [Candidatus Omnitrophota bacterium]
MPKKDLGRAKQIAFQLLKFRNRSIQEIKDRLKRKSFPDDIILQTIVFLVRLRYLNDEEFALSFAQSRLAKPLGFRRIFFELEQKGVDREIIEQTLEKLKQGHSEEDIIEKLAKERFKKLKSIEKYKAKNRVYAFLVRRGFNPELVKGVMEKL